MNAVAIKTILGLGLEAMQKMLVVAIATRYDPVADACCASHSELAKDAGMSPTSVKRHIGALVKAGVLAVEAQRPERGKLRGPNRYRLLLARTGRGGVPSHGMGPRRTDAWGQADPVNRIRTKREESAGGSRRPEVRNGVVLWNERDQATLRDLEARFGEAAVAEAAATAPRAPGTLGVYPSQVAALIEERAANIRVRQEREAIETLEAKYLNRPLVGKNGRQFQLTKVGGRLYVRDAIGISPVTEEGAIRLVHALESDASVKPN